MGRPLNKKYFGNRNIGTGGYQNGAGDDFIGGEGVASYGSITVGSGWTTIPTVTFSAPALPDGVNVTGTAHYKALSLATTANGTGYDIGDTVEVATGTASTAAQATVAAITVVGTPTKSAGGSGYADGDLLTFSGAGWTTNLILRVNRPGGGTGSPDNFTVTQVGVRSAAAPTNPVAYTSRTGSGSGCTVDITWGVYSFSAPTVAGDYTTFPSTGASGTLTTVTGSGTGAKATTTMGLLSVAVNEKGSGYINPADAAVSFTGSTGAAATAVLTTDNGGKLGTGDLNSTSNQDNAILIYAKTTSGGTVQLGDVIKQEGSRRYKVKTADGTAVVKLVAKASPAFKEAKLIATDFSGATYYVTKLTAHKAVLTSTGTGTPQFTDGASVPWTLGAAVTQYSVTIANA